MKIDAFLGRHVEGHLFKDLDAMSTISLKAGEAYGAVGYPVAHGIRESNGARGDHTVANDTAFAEPSGFGLPARAVLRCLRSLDSAAVRVRSRTPETRHV